MANPTTVATKGWFGLVTDRIVAVATRGWWGILGAGLEEVTLESVSVAQPDITASVTQPGITASTANPTVTIQIRNRID